MKIIRSRSFKINLQQGQEVLITLFLHSFFAPWLKQIVICVSTIMGTYPLWELHAAFWGPSHYLLLLISIDEASFADNNQI